MSTLKLPTLLVVTENPSVRIWVKKHLDQDFFIIDTSRKKAALEAAQTAALDFVIVDSELEECDALELCSVLHKTLRTLTPILLITGRLKKSYLDAALEAGVTDFLNQQLDPEELQVRVATIRKNQSVREKTQGISAALPRGNEDLSTNFLKDRVLLHNRALNMLKEAKAKGVLITALIIGIDHFEETRSKIGYLSMEETLSSCMNQIKKHLGKDDLMIPSQDGRLIVLLQNASQEKAKLLAEMLKKELAKTPSQITLSIAVSSLEGTENDFNLMMDSSSKALKKAKDLIVSIHKKEKS
ncbi:MAG: response regulator [Chlamydiae bacterium]|nr:response regulator [Chlamydiota bacterium]